MPGVDEHANWCLSRRGQREFGKAECQTNFCTISRARFFFLFLLLTMAL